MPRRKPLTIRQRAHLSPTGTVLFEQVDSQGEYSAKAVDGRGKIVGRAKGIKVSGRDGATFRGCGDAEDGRALVRFQVRALVRTMKAKERADWLSYWASQGIKLVPCYNGDQPAVEAYREYSRLYVWSVQGGTEETIRRLGQSAPVVLLRQGMLPDGSGTSLEYRRLQDQRKHEKGRRQLDYNHGNMNNGVASFPSR